VHASAFGIAITDARAGCLLNRSRGCSRFRIPLARRYADAPTAALFPGLWLRVDFLQYGSLIMASKPLRYFRAKSLRMLKGMYPDDPAYVRERMTDFDRRNGIDKARPLRPNRLKAKPFGRHAALTRLRRRGERLVMA
jgi:hypothetical protein